MKIIINIDADTFLLCHEALSMAFALAAFDHQIQLTIGDGMLNLLLDTPTGKLAHMLASLDMYDMAPAWLALAEFDRLKAWQTNQSTTFDWCAQVSLKPTTAPHFDTTFDL
ncbi:hypothetical protein KZX29_00730 [Moraxella osloensis]|uniref:hypothetical protein n=1 Tax=Faucicola osloensis TaxID=34062 RepID=UPI002005F75F|nr:hypothetical protein [Moraxella osloensis]MCK6157327.1 hypothetical protein [Moraxella osloensis]